MSKRKVGKNRLDKYYHLAKEKGYRARSAFKLIQLDQKYGMLSNCSSVVDLCASPGGWLQVVAERNIETVVGIDIVPIKPIPGVECIVCDITTDTCRKELYRVLGESKVDLFLHDGSPNSGVSWVQDAYAQNELVLFAMKLASEFLREGGAFLTKVFRSSDYCALLSVCNRIFEVVEATKPLSSRSESAEIFVYCKGFLPDRVRTDIFNPNVAFREVEVERTFNTIKVLEFADFLKSVSTLRELQSFEKIRYSAIEGLEEVVDEETRLSFEDLQLLGPSAMKNLLRKRRKILRLIESNKVSVNGVDASALKSLPRRKEKDQECTEQVSEDDASAVTSLPRRKEKDQECTEQVNEDDASAVTSLPRRKERDQECTEQVSEDDASAVTSLPRRKERDQDWLVKESRKERKKRQKDKKGRREKQLPLPNTHFFNDRIFVSDDEEPREETAPQVLSEEGSEISSCSDSMELDEEELLAAARLKEDEEEFIMETIDRHCNNDLGNLPDFIREEEKVFERRFARPLQNKKELEAIGRRRRKALKIAQKASEKKEENDADDEDCIARKRTMRGPFRKTRSKPRIVFATKGRIRIPKGKGRLKFVDRRMKKDKRGMKSKR